jgi:hypothetical protein
MAGRCSTTPRIRSILLNPFFPDEFVTNASGEKIADGDRFAPGTAGEMLENSLTQEDFPQVAGEDRDWAARIEMPYLIHLPPRVRREIGLAGQAGHPQSKDIKLKVALLFCVGDQMNRAGLRHFFRLSNDSVLVTVPGFESGNTLTTPRTGQRFKIQTPWGCGITTADIRDLLTKVKAPPDVQFDVTVIAAYSIGHKGMCGTINESGIRLDKIERMIFYDALYNNKGRVAKAIAAVRAANKSKPARIIAYGATTGGTPGIETNSLAQQLKPGELIDLFNNGLGVVLRDLTFARMFQTALADFRTDNGTPKLVLEADVPQVYRDLIPRLPVRGELASSQTNARTFGKSSWLEKWGQDTQSIRSRIKATDLQTARTLIYCNQLLGWIPDKDEDKGIPMIDASAQHDQFMPEFAWEFLPPS